AIKSMGYVTRKIYKILDHCASDDVRDPVATTGSQNNNPATRKDARSTACHAADCMPSVKTAGTCHPMRTDVATSQHIAGREKTRQRRAAAGVPSQRSGGPSVISSRC